MINEKKIIKSNERINLNIFPNLINNAKRSFNLCPGKKLCPNCLLFKKNNGFCSGCDENYFNRCLKNFCYTKCNVCGGGRHLRVPACCARAPMHTDYIKLIDLEIPQYSPKPPEIKCKFIPILYNQIAKYRIPELFPQIDAWAVPMHKIMNSQGKFRAKNLKKYLGLPNNKILILSSCSPDNFMEMFWQKWNYLNFKKYNIDAWFPANFSIYDNDCKFYQFFNAKRQQIHALKVKSQFVWFRLGENIPIEFLNPIKNSNSVIISSQQMYSSKNRAILKHEVEMVEKWFPPQTKFFVVGKIASNFFSKTRSVYNLDSRWIMCALKGRTIKDRYLPNTTIKKLLIKNLKDNLMEKSCM